MVDLGQFSQQFGQGMRPTLFRVEGQIPTGETVDKSFYIKSAQMPASSLGVIEVPYKGRKLKRPGDRTFAEWSLTVLSDAGGALRADFVNWMNAISGHSTTGTVNEGYGAEWLIIPEDNTGNPISSAIITMINCFPTEVGAMEFSYETTDSISEFTVTMQFDYWVGGGGS
tara:strand:- start:59 stop:568 length:510 start_codon:yes stop_codon:yes gene_type:complete